MTTPDPYADEAARLRAGVQDQLRAGAEPTLTPYEQFLLCGWYERELHRLQTSEETLAAKVDESFAARLEAARGRWEAEETLDQATTIQPRGDVL